MRARSNDDKMRREAKLRENGMSGYEWHDLVGNIGVAMILGTYFALQIERLDSKSVAYSALNGLGAGSITLSLLFNFNLSAFVVEAAWVAVSLFGLTRALRRRSSNA